MSTASTPPPSPPSPATSLFRAWETYRRTVSRNPWIKKEPTRLPDGSTHYGPHPKQQQFLLHAFTRELFFGGAGGGGKSQAIWYGALQYADTPGYAALILRRTYADLSLPKSLMQRAQAYLAGTGAVWNEQRKTFTFPSGATVTFGYLETENDKHRYASAEFQYIAFDELTHFTETQYSFLFTRLRRLAGFDVPLRMRSASNPGGPGHTWVYSRFVSDRSRRPGAAFIRSHLEDNPSLDEAEYDASLANTDPVTRARIRRGDWEAHADGRLKRAWLEKTRYWPERGLFRVAQHLYPANLITGRFLTVDPAASVQETAKDDPDWTVISAWGLTPCGKLLWLGCKRVRVEVPDIPPLVAEEYERHGAGEAYVEAGGMQKGVYQLCTRAKTAKGKHMSVIPCTPRRDKLDRAADALSLAKSGRLWLPRSAAEAPGPPFPLEDVEAEIFRFTGDPGQDGHDDVMDTLSMAGQKVAGKLDAPKGTWGGSLGAR